MCFYNGEKYNCDLVRFIKKFDVYVCDLGEVDINNDDGTISKARPCVILSSDDSNHPKSTLYMIAPIRTERQIQFTRETVETVVQERRKTGRIYVPINMDDSAIRFIDVTQIRPIHVSKITKYCGTLINSDLITRINTSIIEVFFSKEEFVIGDRHNKIEVKEIETFEGDTLEIEPLSEEVNQVEEPKQEEVQKPVKVDKRKKKTNFPVGFSKYYELYKQGKMTVTKMSKKFNVTNSTTYYYIKRYEELQTELSKH